MRLALLRKQHHSRALTWPTWLTAVGVLALLALGGCGQDAPATSTGAGGKHPAAASPDPPSQSQTSAARGLQAAWQADQNASPDTTQTGAPGLPRLLDLGAGKCIPCKKMAPILDELRKEYAGAMEVVFIDVWQNPSVAVQYGIEAIPTQIFFDASGKELFRHEGFYSKEEILAKWKELGIPLTRPPAAAGR